MTQNNEQSGFDIIEAFYHPKLGLVVVDWDRATDEIMMINAPMRDVGEAQAVLARMLGGDDDDNRLIGTMRWLE